MLIFSTHITPRLEYIIHFFSNELGNEPWQLTTNKDVFINTETLKINYSTITFATKCITILPHTLLFENGIRPQSITVSQKNDIPVFFQSETVIGFDIFAASFYLLSRYEEYLPGQKDQYGRYMHENSLAHKNGFLQKPLINIWLQEFKKQIATIFYSAIFKTPQFLFVPTYDIDMAWSYRHKGILRSVGNSAKDIITGHWAAFARRVSVLSGKQKDPFDHFGWLHQLHEKNQLKPYYFFLVGERTNQYDKNISPHNKLMRRLIADHIIRYPVGLHPSWHSNKNIAVLQKEKAILEKITGTNISATRQHYLKLSLPHTYRILLQAGLQFDFSMGYSGANGFRASVASPFYWYDIENETTTSLFLFPFCFMEVTSVFYKKETPEQALQELVKLYGEVKNVDGFFSIIWHNSSFCDADEYKGWREMYANFIAKIEVEA